MLPILPAKLPVREILLPFFTITAVSLVLITAVLLYHSNQEIKTDIQVVKTAQVNHLLAGKRVILQELIRLRSDLDIIAHMPALRFCLNHSGSEKGRDHTALIFESFLRYKPYYFQLRFLDTNAHEVIRVERRKGQVIITDQQNLQDKSKRYYMQDMFHMQQGEMYISPLDLNVEQGKISLPHTPVLRLGRAVYDDRRHKKGFVVLNYKGRDLLKLFRTVISKHEGRLRHPVNNTPLVVDRDGQFLLADDRSDEWGVLLHHGHTFSRRFPDLWQQMQKLERGQWHGPWGLLTFQRINLLTENQISGSGALPGSPSTGGLLRGDSFHWYLLSHVSQEEMSALGSLSRHFPWAIFSVALPALSLFSWILAALVVANRSNLQILEAQQHHFHLLYEHAPLPYQSLDGNGCLLEVNQAWCTILGYNKDEVLGRNFAEFLCPGSRTSFKESFVHFLETGTINDCRILITRQDDTPILASFYGQLHQGHPGEPRQAHCIFIDITELQEKGERIEHLNLVLQTIILIHRSIARQRHLQKLLNDCCSILTDCRGYLSAWIVLLDEKSRPTTQASSGLRHDFKELFRQIGRGSMPPCILKARRHDTAIAIASPKEFCDQCPMANGYLSAGTMCAPLKYNDHIFGYLTVSLQVQLAKDEDELQRFSELAEDIGLALFTLEQQQQRQTAEQNLFKALQALQEAQEVAHIGNYERNWQTGEGFLSDNSYLLFGYEPGEITFTHAKFFGHIFPEDRKRIISELEESKKQPTPFATNFRIIRKDGAIRIIHSTGRCIFDADGNPLLHRGLFQDVTEQKNMEAQLLQTEKLTTIAGLAAGVSHELNTPLSAILQSIQVIEMALAPDRADNEATAAASGIDLRGMHDYFKRKQIDFFFQGIRESATRASSIVRNLLDFSRPRQEEMTLVDINSLINSSVDLAHADYELKKKYDIINVAITKEYDSSLPKVRCVAMEVEQVLLNLIKNAAQSMAGTERKSCLTLRTKQIEDKIRVEVKDNGPGIEEKTLAHIFDPFFTTKDIGQGTGLGLSIAYGIIRDKHRGSILARSTPGRGTTFIIDLPIEQTAVS